jgi:PKHD-type hydroxylase
MAESARQLRSEPPRTERALTPLVETNPCFTDDECARIIAEGRALPLAKGHVTAVERAPDARNSTIALFPPEERYGWMLERIAQVVNSLNRQHWAFELVGSERLQFSAYGPGEYYDWHVDLAARGSFALRKLSISVLLNDPAEYEGGDLEVSVGTTNKIACRTKGAVILFPSYALHRVHKITKGTRYSLVAWIVGNQPFR